MNFRLRPLAVCLAVAAGLHSAPAAAAGASDWAGVPEAEVRLIAADTALPEGENAVLGLEFRLQPGWKTYWRDPGEAGAPPQIDWSGSENVAEVETLWPAPKRFSLFGFDSFGYTGELVLPLIVRPARSDRPVALRAQVRYLICSDLCVPAEAELALELPAGTAAPTAHRDRIDAARAQVPRTGADAPVRFVSAKAMPGGERPALEVTVSAEGPLDEPDLMIEGPRPYSFGRPDVELAVDRRRATLRLPIYGATDVEGLDGQAVTLTLVDGATAAEGRLTISR